MGLGLWEIVKIVFWRDNLSVRSRVHTGEKPCKGCCLMMFVMMWQRVP